MTTYRFSGVEYTADDRARIVAALAEDPDMIPAFTDGTLETIRGLFGWGAYGQAKAWFNVMCDVLADVAERRGQSARR